MPATQTAATSAELALINAFAAASLAASAHGATVAMRDNSIFVTMPVRTYKANALTAAKVAGPAVVKAVNESGALAMWKKGSGWVAGGYDLMGIFYTTSYTRTYIVKTA